MTMSQDPVTTSEEQYKDCTIVITTKELADGRWQASYSAQGYDNVADPRDSVEEAREEALSQARRLIDRWLG